MQSVRTGRACRSARGFTYLVLLLAIAMLGLGLLAVSEVWSATVRHQKLVQLDWVGAQLTFAIGSYYQATPDAVVKTHPPSLQELLRDSRYVTVRRHLREIYNNPFTGNSDWDLIRASDGGVRGVRVSLPENDGSVVKEYVYLGRSESALN